MVAAVHTKGEGLNSVLDIFSKEYRRAVIFCALVTLAPIAYGYDGTYFTALLETPTFGEFDRVVAKSNADPFSTTIRRQIWRRVPDL
jgi:hypothetical protein